MQTVDDTDLDMYFDNLDPTGFVAAMDGAAEGVLDRLGPLDGRQFLEVECGDGSYLSSASDRGAVVWGVDQSAALLWLARYRLSGVDLRQGAADALPFDTGSFDVVCRFGVAGEDAGTEASLGEMARVCRRGGHVAVTVIGLDEAETHERVAGVRRIAARLGLVTLDKTGGSCPARAGNDRRGTVQAVILTM